MNGPGAAAFGEEHRGLTCRVTATNDCDVLRIVENGLDGGACVVNSRGFEAVCVFGIELSPAHAHCDQHGASPKFGSAVEMQEVTIFRDGRRLDPLDPDRRYHLRAELEHLKHAPCCQFGAGKPARKAHEVFDLRRTARLTAGPQPVEHDC